MVIDRGRRGVKSHDNYQQIMSTVVNKFEFRDECHDETTINSVLMCVPSE